MSLVGVWFSEANLLRILFGRDKRCTCQHTNHAVVDIRWLNRQQHRNVLLHLYGPSRFNALRRRQLLTRGGRGGDQLAVHEQHVFLDEYATFMRTFSALSLPCNQARRSICHQFSCWLVRQTRKLHEHHRTANLQQWEHSVRRELCDQTRVNHTLSFQLQFSNERFAKLQQNYESLLRSVKPTVSPPTE